MSYQSKCVGRVVLGDLPAEVQARLSRLPGEWLEFDPDSRAVVISHIQPSTAPILPTVTVELVRMLAVIPHEHQTAIAGGDLYVHTEEPSTQLVRLRVEQGGSVHIQWAHPDYAGAAKQPWKGGEEIAIPAWEHRLNGTVTFDCDDPAGAAEALQTLADTYEGLYPEGDFRADAGETGPGVTVTMREVNLDGALLVERLRSLARPGSLDGRFELGSFADFLPEHLIRVLFERGEIRVQRPLLWA